MSDKLIREHVVECVNMLAAPSEQIEYERRVPYVQVPQELVSMFADDLFHPKSPELINSFSETELRDLSELYGLVCQASRVFEQLDNPTVAAILKIAEWRAVVAHAQALSSQLDQ